MKKRTEKRNSQKKNRTRKQKNREKDGEKNGEKKYRKNTYNEADFSSGDGMLTSVWGPSLWHSLHTISFNYPVHPTQKQKEHYRSLLLNLKYVLPCKWCRINLKKNFKQLPLTMKVMKNRETFSRYVYSLHELVNKMLNKKSGLTYDQVRERYEHFRARCNKTHKNKHFVNKKRTQTIKNKIKKIIHTTTKKIETGCTEPLVGEKAKCVLSIIPQNEKRQSFEMDKRCIKRRME